MTTDDETPDPTAVLAAFKIDADPLGLTQVGGAWSNQVYRLDTSAGSFAVKQICNPWELAERTRWQWLAEAWSFEQRALAEGVPAPEPIPNPVNGHCLAWVDRGGPVGHRGAFGRVDEDDQARSPARVPIRLHRWADGEAFGPGPVEPEVSRWAGRVLSVLHGLRVKPKNRDVFPVPNTDTADSWPELTDATHRAGEPWADQLTTVAPDVRLIADLVRSVGHRADEEVMSHGDIDQKNLIATTHGPVLCDWDVAVPVVPRRELADVALSLGAGVSFDVAKLVVRAYRDAGGDDTDIQPADLGPSLMASLDWVAFNVERAIGRRQASPAQQALARNLAPGLIAAIPEEVDVALRVREFLRI